MSALTNRPIVPWLIVLLAIVMVSCGQQAGMASESVTKRVSGGCPDFIDLIKELTPSVVNISIERDMVSKSSSGPPPLFRSSPGRFDEYPRAGEKSQTDTLGSGFFCDAEGHIVTNAHVVEGANKILVTLSSGKVLPGKIVAVHPRMDLALIRVSPPHKLKKAKIGDSSAVQVGEWVLAVGNPFGLGRTVTVGIVSGKGRFIGLGPHDNFIQTDASINPGNSGGPLFNMAGEVVGINTAIISAGRGIGFSIPSNYIKELLKLPESGETPVRGWLGIFVDDAADKQRESGQGAVKGIVIDEVLASTPAHDSGLKKGDIILDADGQQVRNGRHLSTIVSASKPGDLIRITVLRGNQTHTVDVKVGKSPE